MKKFFLTLICAFFSWQTCGTHCIQKPRVSIITSVYKGDNFIAGFLSDITRQTVFEECELIIINANSPGNEEPLIKEYIKKFPNIVYKKLDHDPGLYAVWNMAIKMARADFITNANLDDRRNPESLEIHAKKLEENPHIDLVYSDYQVTLTPNETFEYNTHQYAIFPDEFSPSIMYKCLPGPQPMWRKNMHSRCGYFDESFKSAGDFEMWNRAVRLGSAFKKVHCFAGLYYLNPQGLSTNEEHRSLILEETERISNQYRSMWFAHYHYYCTAADNKYFICLLNLIGSIHKTSFDILGEIAIFDLGLTKKQIAFLNTISKVSVHSIEQKYPDILKQFQTSYSGKMVPGWYAWKFVVLKQALETFPYVLWLDAGSTVLQPLHSLFKYIQQAGYFLSTMGDEKFFNHIAHPIEWGTTEYVKKHFNLYDLEKKWVLNQEPLLSSPIGVSRKAMDYLVKPLYNFSENLKLFEDDGTTSQGFGTGRHDQTILSIFAYLHGLTVHQQDYTQQQPIYLSVEGKNEPFYITWNKEYLCDKTCLYSSRWDLEQLEHYLSCIRYK